VRGRLLDLCLLAYPGARRERDREYLRDLALDLAETQGLLRQAWSLLSGGLKERIELRRRWSGASLEGLVKRALVACFVLAAPAVAAGWLIVSEGGDRLRVSEVERAVCEFTQDAPSTRNGAPITNGSGCAATDGLVAARERAGWECTTREHVRSHGRTTTWRCIRG
jgi:hypothetical protein